MLYVGIYYCEAFRYFIYHQQTYTAEYELVEECVLYEIKVNRGEQSFWKESGNYTYGNNHWRIHYATPSISVSLTLNQIGLVIHHLEYLA